MLVAISTLLEISCCGSFYNQMRRIKGCVGIAVIVEPDQADPLEQCDLGLHFLLTSMS